MTFLSILANLNNTVVWMVSTLPLIFKSSGPFINLLVTVLRAPITFGIIVTLMFHSFFNSIVRSTNIFTSFHLLLILQQNPQFRKFSFYFYLLIIIRSGRLAEIKGSDWMSKFQMSLYVSFFHDCCTPYIMDSPSSINARGVIVNVVGNEHGDTSSNPGRDWLYFT